VDDTPEVKGQYTRFWPLKPVVFLASALPPKTLYIAHLAPRHSAAFFYARHNSINFSYTGVMSGHYAPPESLRPIEIRDFAKVLAAGFGVIGFFAFIIAVEWNRSEFTSKLLGISLLVAASLLFLRPLIIYRPQNVNISEFTILRGPHWSATVIGIKFVWLDVIDRHGVRKRIRLIEDISKVTEIT
jgi:hypothetical protein